jgi:hypothetical protein
MSRGGRTIRSVVAAAVCVAGPSAALAAKLDKAACASLASELSSVLATGVKAEMERGPEWAKANMPPERLESALRLLEIEDQLEFRCGGRGKVTAKPEQTAAPGATTAPGAPNTPAATTTPGTTTTPGVLPANVPPDSTKAAEQPPRMTPTPPATETQNGAPAMLAPLIKPPVALKPAQVAPAPPTQRSSALPPAVAPASTAPAVATKAPPVVATPTVVPATKPAQAAVVAANPPIAADPNQQAVAVPIGPTPSGPMPVPGAKRPGDPTGVVAKKKNPRRNPSSAYVAPADVSPFSLPGLR